MILLSAARLGRASSPLGLRALAGGRWSSRRAGGRLCSKAGPERWAYPTLALPPFRPRMILLSAARLGRASSPLGLRALAAIRWSSKRGGGRLCSKAGPERRAYPALALPPFRPRMILLSAARLWRASSPLGLRALTAARWSLKRAGGRLCSKAGPERRAYPALALPPFRPRMILLSAARLWRASSPLGLRALTAARWSLKRA